MCYAFRQCAPLSEGRAGGRAEGALSLGVGGLAPLPGCCSPARAPLDVHPPGGPARRSVLPRGSVLGKAVGRPELCVGVGCAAPRRPPLGGGGGGAGGGLFPGVGVGVGPGRGEPMMSAAAAAAAAGPGRGQALGGPGPELEPEPELEAGETGAAGGGHGDEPGLADAAPSQSGGPRGELGRARADRSQLPGPLSAARRCGSPDRAPRPDRSPLGLSWGRRGRGLSLAPPPGAHDAGGRLRGPWYGVRARGGRGTRSPGAVEGEVLTPSLKG